jgi:hypothetical protein
LSTIDGAVIKLEDFIRIEKAKKKEEEEENDIDEDDD